MGGAVNQFDKYLSTCFLGRRDVKASHRFYDDNYGKCLPEDRRAPILDIGCGTGECISYLMSRGYTDVRGIDVSPEMVDYCRKNGIPAVSVASDTTAYLWQNKAAFDVIVMNDVIEHIPKSDTVAMLRALRAALKDGGTLLLRTGNFSTLGGIYLRYKDFTHEIGYTDCSLEQVLRMAGFSDLCVWGNNYPINHNPLSVVRYIGLRTWFFMLKMIYTLELGCDKPRIYSKLLVAACKK